MKITIITACYNSVATIRDALESVAAQRVVDDWHLTDGERPEAIDIAAVRESALKSFAEVDDEDKRRIVCAIETTKVIPLRMPSDERLKRFIKGYWDGDPKTIREIVQWGGAIIPTNVKNRYIGDIQTHRNAIRSILFHTRFRGPLKVLVLERLADILRDAVLYNKGKDGDETFYNLAHRLSFDPCDGSEIKEFVVRLIVKETADGKRTWTIGFSNKKELTGVPTTGEAATVEVTHLKPPSSRTILKWIYAVNRMRPLEIEHIVVDGGSSDGTVEVIKKFENEAEKRGGGGQLNFTEKSVRGGGTVFRWISEKDRGMYDAINKGMRMATGDVIGILNADDVLAEDDVLERIVRLFDCSIDGCYGDIRFVRDGDLTQRHGDAERVDGLRGLPTVRYCSGKRFRPWMFRFGTQTAHPSTFFRKECFAKWGEYSLDYGMYGDFELLCRFIWKNKARMKYLPLCTTVMRMGGASTNGWRTTLKINQSDLRALKANGCWSCLPFLYSRYFLKIWGFLFKN